MHLKFAGALSGYQGNHCNTEPMSYATVWYTTNLGLGMLVRSKVRHTSKGD